MPPVTNFHGQKAVDSMITVKFFVVILRIGISFDLDIWTKHFKL